MSEEKPDRPKDGAKKDGDTEAFRIRRFEDLRKLRRLYRKGGEQAAAGERGAVPDPDKDEEDFGLKRTTLDEAWEFYRKSLSAREDDDELAEFLDDL